MGVCISKAWKERKWILAKHIPTFPHYRNMPSRFSGYFHVSMFPGFQIITWFFPDYYLIPSRKPHSWLFTGTCILSSHTIETNILVSHMSHIGVTQHDVTSVMWQCDMSHNPMMSLQEHQFPLQFLCGEKYLENFHFSLSFSEGIKCWQEKSK